MKRKRDGHVNKSHGKAKDILRRREARMQEQAGDNALVLKRFKVSVLLAGLHNYTVVALSPQEAAQKVINGQGGQPAGVEGPGPILTRVHPMDDLSVPAPHLKNMIEMFIQQVLEDNQRHVQQGNGVPAGQSGIIAVAK